MQSGVGFSERLYDLGGELFRTAGGFTDDCPCETGCTSCVGVPTEPSLNGQRFTRRLVGAK